MEPLNENAPRVFEQSGLRVFEDRHSPTMTAAVGAVWPRLWVTEQDELRRAWGERGAMIYAAPVVPAVPVAGTLAVRLDAVAADHVGAVADALAMELVRVRGAMAGIIGETAADLAAKWTASEGKGLAALATW